MTTMVPPAEIESPKSSRKRKNDDIAPAKAMRTIRKVEEKENLSKTPSPTTSTSTPSSAGSSRESPNVVVASIRRRERKSQPVKLENLKKIVKRCSTSEELERFFNLHNESETRKFLVSNVIDKKRLISKKAKLLKREMLKIDDILPSIEDKACERNEMVDLCTLNITKINSWGTSMDASNYATSAASVQSFTMIVDMNNKTKVVPHGLSVVSMAQKHLTESDESNIKYVKVTREELKNAKFIYFVAIVKRMIAKESKRGATRRCAAAAPSSKTSESVAPQQLEQFTRIGCMQVYKKDGRNSLDSGIQRMILVDRDRTDKPVFAVIFQEMDEMAKSDNPTQWMENVPHMDEIDKENLIKADQHIPRLMFTTDSPDFDDILEEIEEGPSSPSEEEEPCTSSSVGQQMQRVEEMETDEQDRIYELKRDEWKAARFPLRPTDDNSIVTHEDSSFGRLPKSSKAVRMSTPKLDINEEEDVEMEPAEAVQQIPLSARNHGVDGKLKYGFDFVQSKGHFPYLRTVYIPRGAGKVPQFDEDKSPELVQNEHYARNNPLLFTEYHLFEDNKVVIPPEHRLPGSEMSLVEVPLTQEQVNSFNNKLSGVPSSVKSTASRKPNPDQEPGAFGMDLDGRPIPKFAEMFFPPQKMEMYNILCRYYYSEAGHRPGAFSAEYKSRLMIGFINKFYKEIFAHKLENIYQKQLQLIALSSPGWSAEHLQKPLNRLRELKKEWKAQTVQGTSN